MWPVFLCLADQIPAMNWNNIIAILLLLESISWLCGLPPIWTEVELAEHYILYPENVPCSEICVHPSSLIDQPQESVSFDISHDEHLPLDRLIALLPHPHAARDRPPPLFWSTSHSLRAPPTLILA